MEEIILPVLGVAFAAFCIWLTVRIINRRERWAKWTAITVVVILVYPLSFGPACWIASRTGGGHAPVVSAVYRPLIWMWIKSPEQIHLTVWRFLVLGRGESGARIVLRIPDYQDTF